MQKMFITGGSRGIGAALVTAAAAAGWDVAFTYRAAKGPAEETLAKARAARPDGTYVALPLDVRDATAVDTVADQVLDELGGIDAVVCNAGITQNDMAYAMPDEVWDDVIATNLSGSFKVSRAFLPELVAQRGGAIVLL